MVDSGNYHHMQGLRGGAGGAIPEEFGQDGDEDAEDNQNDGASTEGKKTRIRTEFPETWLWIDKHTE